MWAAAGFAQSDPVFDAKGFQQNRDYFAQAPYENIDTLSGGLVLTFTDLVLPGNGGRDLKFQRTFNSKEDKWTFGLAGFAMQVAGISGEPYPGYQTPDDYLPHIITADGADHPATWMQLNSFDWAVTGEILEVQPGYPNAIHAGWDALLLRYVRASG